MRLPVLLICIALGLAGCASPEREAAINALEQRLDAQWIKSHVITGQTTKAQIAQWYGEPFHKVSTFASGYAGAAMPDEMWTYAFKISHKVGHFGTYDFATTRYGLSVAFKDGTVSTISVSSM